LQLELSVLILFILNNENAEFISMKLTHFSSKDGAFYRRQCTVVCCERFRIPSAAGRLL